jgi:predicted lipid-binding transport protein (Tim44 family)
MRKALFFAFAAALLGGSLAALDAEAARIGGGRSIGAQRSVTSAPTKPAQQTQQAAPNPQQGAAAAPGAQPQPSGWSKWGPLLGGLALGGALGWLMGANGLGGLMVGILLAMLLAIVVLALVRALALRRAGAGQPAQYAGLGSETVAAPPPSQASGFERAPAAAASAAIPDGFDVAGFLRAAKLNYMKLQIANDKGDLEELREFTSPELFDELKRDVLGRGGASQHTDVLSLNADLLEVATEGDKHWASVRFSGTIRESAAGPTGGFEEVWNLAKPVDGSSGWTLAGIQQMH